ncbi:unnamed protein product [Acanthosepion pharaonis]|uniref:Uncharacterized protein n=1 Tax=Acanthosepion pharaonis TaxID=158019 RepID=A0A812DAF7_ACAPH|nr:unnamed protein product [Sepia pharaonis]
MYLSKVSLMIRIFQILHCLLTTHPKLSLPIRYLIFLFIDLFSFLCFRFHHLHFSFSFFSIYSLPFSLSLSLFYSLPVFLSVIFSLSYSLFIHRFFLPGLEPLIPVKNKPETQSHERLFQLLFSFFLKFISVFRRFIIFCWFYYFLLVLLFSPGFSFFFNITSFLLLSISLSLLAFSSLSLFLANYHPLFIFLKIISFFLSL